MINYKTIHLDRSQTIVLFSFFYLLIGMIIILVGYSTNGDSWRVVNSAYLLYKYHIYQWSRVPGHPVVEFGYSFVIWGGLVLANFLTLIISLIGLLAFNKILVLKNIDNAGLLTLLLSIWPVWWISSTIIIDYIWSVTFILVSIYFLLDEKYVSSALFLSLGVGSRLSNGFVGVFFILFFIATKTSPKNIIKFFISGTVTTIVWLIPLYIRYQFGFLTYDIIPAWDIIRATKLIATNIGILFTIGAPVILLFFFLKNYQVFLKDLMTFDLKLWQKYIKNNKFEINLIITIIIFFIAYLYQPARAEYLLPAIPLFLIFIGKFISRKIIWAFIILLMVSSFLPISYNYSPGLNEISTRIDTNSYFHKLFSYHFTSNDVLIAIYYQPALEYFQNTNMTVNWQKGFMIVYSTNYTQVTQWISNHINIFYLEEAKAAIQLSINFNLNNINATAI